RGRSIGRIRDPQADGILQPRAGGRPESLLPVLRDVHHAGRRVRRRRGDAGRDALARPPVAGGPLRGLPARRNRDGRVPRRVVRPHRTQADPRLRAPRDGRRGLPVHPEHRRRSGRAAVSCRGLLPVYIPVVALYGYVLTFTDNLLGAGNAGSATTNQLLIVVASLGIPLGLSLAVSGRLSDRARLRRPFMALGLACFGGLAILLALATRPSSPD